jgi:hypothetical protein
MADRTIIDVSLHLTEFEHKALLDLVREATGPTNNHASFLFFQKLESTLVTAKEQPASPAQSAAQFPACALSRRRNRQRDPS